MFYFLGKQCERGVPFQPPNVPLTQILQPLLQVSSMGRLGRLCRPSLLLLPVELLPVDMARRSYTRWQIFEGTVFEKRN